MKLPPLLQESRVEWQTQQQQQQQRGASSLYSQWMRQSLIWRPGDTPRMRRQASAGAGSRRPTAATLPTVHFTCDGLYFEKAPERRSALPAGHLTHAWVVRSSGRAQEARPYIRASLCPPPCDRTIRIPQWRLQVWRTYHTSLEIKMASTLERMWPKQ